jgi:neutral/alkaline ceramidase-like enzyme
MAELTIGFGRRDITPPLGVPNVLGVTCFAEEIWDPLYVTAAVLTMGAERAVIIGTDLCVFYQAPHRMITKAVSEALGVPLERVVLNTSHTHSSSVIGTELQEIMDPYGIKVVDLDYVEYLKQQIVAAAMEAADHTLPARLHAGNGRVEHVASNRRPKLPNGKTIHRYGQPPEELRVLPEGLIDPEVLVVRVDDRDGGPLGAFVNYACHPTAAGGSCHGWVSADYVGVGCRRIEAALAGAPCLFLQGCAGNIGTGKWVTGNPRQDMEDMGRRFAAGALQALEKVEPITVNSLSMTQHEVPMALDPFPSLDELKRRMEEAIKANDWMMIAYGDAMVISRRLLDFQHARIAGIALGDFAIACLPAEVFVEFGQEIKRCSPFRHTLVCAYNDNSLQYIPTAAAYPEGEFEVDGGWRYVVVGEGEKLQNRVVQMLTEIKAHQA